MKCCWWIRIQFADKKFDDYYEIRAKIDRETVYRLEYRFTCISKENIAECEEDHDATYRQLIIKCKTTIHTIILADVEDRLIAKFEFGVLQNQ